MADGTTEKLTQGLTVVGLTIIPAFGGQFVSAIAKAGSDKLRDMATSHAAVEFAADLGGGAVVAALEVGAVALIGKAGAAKRVLPYAAAGAVLGAVLPQLDKVIDGAVRRLVSKATDVSTTLAPADAAPGGTSTSLRSIPGGLKEDAYYSRSKRLSASRPGGGLTVESNQAVPVPMSHRLKVF